MTPELRVVADTNVIISRLLAPNSVPGQVVSHAVHHGRVLASSDTLEELAGVIAREKFDPYLTLEERQQFMRLLGRIVDMPAITHRFTDCRYASDNKFLDLAVSGNATAIVTGDQDLLELHPFQNIPIITPKTYLQSHP